MHWEEGLCSLLCAEHSRVSWEAGRVRVLGTAKLHFCDFRWHGAQGLTGDSYSSNKTGASQKLQEHSLPHNPRAFSPVKPPHLYSFARWTPGRHSIKNSPFHSPCWTPSSLPLLHVLFHTQHTSFYNIHIINTLFIISPYSDLMGSRMFFFCNLVSGIL